TEPSLSVYAGTLYMATVCATVPGDNTRIVLFEEDAGGDWSYVGVLADAGDVTPLNTSFDGNSAPELINVGGAWYLLVTPTTMNTYRGCVTFLVQNMATAALRDVDANGADPVGRVEGLPGTFNGACTYHDAAADKGVFLSQADVSSILP